MGSKSSPNLKEEIKIKTKRVNSTFLILVFLSLLYSSAVSNNVSAVPIADIIFKTNSGGIRPDYGTYIANYLDDININVTIVIEEWSVFVGTLLVTHDFDLAYVGLSQKSTKPDLSSIFRESGSLNAAGIEQTIPYCDLNEDMLTEGTTIMNFNERQTHYYQWQQLLMDRIIPVLPFFCYRIYTTNWATLDGFDLNWGVVDSLPYMEYSGLHSGQVSTDEFIVSDSMWVELNPLFSDDTTSGFLISLTSESLLQMSPSGEVVNTGLIENWAQDDSNPNLFNFTLRDNIFWNPSFNVTARTSSSSSLLTETSPGVWEVTDPGILMTGLKAGETSNGATQQVTAKDAVFTLLAWGNPIVSEDTSRHDWIDMIWVDSVDSLTFWIQIDGDPDTPELELYADFWETLTIELLPEFFLNSSDSTITYTDGHVKTWGLYSGIENTPQWRTFSESVFGCGKYMLDYYVKNSNTVLEKSPFWMEIGCIDGTTQDLDISNVIVRVIPDDNAALEEYEAGKLDLLDITNNVTARVAHQADPNFEVQSILGNSLGYMYFNLQRPFLGDTDNYIYLTEPGKEIYTKACAIRKAICYAIDRDEMNTILHDGENLVSDSVINPKNSFWYYNEIIKYERNLTLAQEWLDAAYNIVIMEYKEIALLILSAISISVIFIHQRKKK